MRILTLERRSKRPPTVFSHSLASSASASRFCARVRGPSTEEPRDSDVREDDSLRPEIDRCVSASFFQREGFSDDVAAASSREPASTATGSGERLHEAPPALARALRLAEVSGEYCRGLSASENDDRRDSAASSENEPRRSKRGDAVGDASEKFPV